MIRMRPLRDLDLEKLTFSSTVTSAAKSTEFEFSGKRCGKIAERAVRYNIVTRVRRSFDRQRMRGRIPPAPRTRSKVRKHVEFSTPANTNVFPSATGSSPQKHDRIKSGSSGSAEKGELETKAVGAGAGEEGGLLVNNKTQM